MTTPKKTDEEGRKNFSFYFIVDSNFWQVLSNSVKQSNSFLVIPKLVDQTCGFLRPICLDKVGRDVICLINGLTTSSSAIIRAELIINRLTVWTFLLRAKSCDEKRFVSCVLNRLVLKNQ